MPSWEPPGSCSNLSGLPSWPASVRGRPFVALHHLQRQQLSTVHRINQKLRKQEVHHQKGSGLSKHTNEVNGTGQQKGKNKNLILSRRLVPLLLRSICVLSSGYVNTELAHGRDWKDSRYSFVNHSRNRTAFLRWAPLPARLGSASMALSHASIALSCSPAYQSHGERSFIVTKVYDTK